MSRKWTAPQYDTFKPGNNGNASGAPIAPLHLAHSKNPAENARGIGRILFLHFFAQMPLTLLIHLTASTTSFSTATWFFGAIAGLLLFTALIKALRFDGMIAQIPGALYTVGIVGILLLAVAVCYWMIPTPGRDRFPSFGIIFPVLLAISLLTSLWPGFLTALGGYRDFTQQANPMTLLIGGLSLWGALALVYASATLPFNILVFTSFVSSTAFAVVVTFEGAALLRANPRLCLRQAQSTPFAYEPLSGLVYASLVGLGLAVAAIIAFAPDVIARLDLPFKLPRPTHRLDAYRMFAAGLLLSLIAIIVLSDGVRVFRCSIASFPWRCVRAFKVAAQALLSFITYNPMGVAHPLTHQIQTAWLRPAEARTLIFSLVLWVNAIPFLASIRDAEAPAQPQAGFVREKLADNLPDEHQNRPEWPLMLTVYFVGPSLVTFLILLVVGGPLLAAYQAHFEENGSGPITHQPLKRGGSKR